MEDVALKTLKEIFLARGRADTEFEPVGGALDETKTYTYDTLLVIFSTKTRVTEKEFKTFLGFADENNHKSGIIIISPSIPSENVLGVLRNHISDPANPLVQIFEIRHLQFDISKHRKVPKHRILSDTEKVAVLKEFNVQDPKLLPKIDSQDAMAKWIGARPTDLVEITGMCEASAQNKRYRFCVADVTNG
jgi:DNA-directed RNA polymerase subunit H (RpoH/RPB5)